MHKSSRDIAALLLSVSIIVMAAGPASAQSVSSAATTAVGADGLGDIIVTAGKREERLRDVPAAITAVSADTIESLGIRDFRDYASLVPGLSQRDLGAPGQGTIILRGLNTSAQQTTNTTAFYLDEAPFSASGFLSVAALLTPSPDLGDVERVEVLKGPQGTLYGATSLGGLIKVVSRAPDASAVSGSALGELSATDGGDVGYLVRGSVNVPILADKLAVRASGGYRRTGGFMDNVGTGRDNVNESEIYGGRLAIRATPTEDLTIDLVGFVQNIRSTGTTLQDNLPDTLRPRYGRYSYSTFDDLQSKIDYRLVSGSVDYDFGPVSWLTTASYSTIDTKLNSDATTIYVPLVAGLVPAGTAGLGSFSPNTDKVTVESRLTSERLGRFEFIAGLFYTDEKSVYPVTILLVNPTTGALIPPPFNTLVRTGTLSDYSEIAGFGNISFYLSDRLDVTGGLRVARNRDRSTTGAPVDGIPASVFFRPRAAVEFRSSDTATTYLATLRWRPTDQISTYLRAASGYRPGGPQTNPAPPPGAQTSIDPDTLWNYEAGLKGSFLDGTLSIDASVFHIDWSDIQLPSLFGGIVLQGNGGKAKVDGFEAAVGIRPSERLRFSATLGYTNARLTDVPAGVTASIGARAGDKLPLTPAFTTSIIGDYEAPLSGDMTLTMGGTLRFQSDMPSNYPGDALNPSLKLPSFETVDLRAGLAFGRFTLQVRGENLFNRLGFTSASTSRLFARQNVPTQAAVIRPRTVVLALGAAF